MGAAPAVVINAVSAAAAVALAKLAALAHLAPEEVGAVMVLELHAAAGRDLSNAEEADLAQLSGIGALWFRRPAGASATRGQRVRQALGLLPVVASAPGAAVSHEAAAPAGGAASGGGLSAAQRAQRRHAANSRWRLIPGGRQPELPLPQPAAEAPPAASSSHPASSPPSLPRAAPPQSPPARQRPDADEISDERAIDYIRGWLWQWAGRELGVPDERTCANVLRAAPGRTLCDVYRALNEVFLRGGRHGRTWGWFVAVMRNHFSAEGYRHGAAAAVAG